MKKILLRGMALIALSAVVLAFEGSFSWTPPTEYTDGTVLLEQDIDFYTLTCDQVVTFQIDSIIGTANWQAPLSTFPPGDHSCSMTVTMLDGQESVPSNTINFTVGPRVPKAPANLALK